MAFSEYFPASLTGISAVASTTTGTVFDISLREKMSFVFTAPTWTSGSGTFTIDGSNDGTNWVTGLAFQDAQATASNTFVTSKALGSATTVGGYLPFVPFKMMRIVCTVTGTGTYTATAQGYGD